MHTQRIPFNMNNLEREKINHKLSYNEVFYLLHNPELILYDGNLYNHWLDFGINENRIFGNQYEIINFEFFEVKKIYDKFSYDPEVSEFISNHTELFGHESKFDFYKFGWIPGRSYWGETICISNPSNIFNIETILGSKYKIYCIKEETLGRYFLRMSNVREQFQIIFVNEDQVKIFFNQGLPLNHFLEKKLKHES